MNKKTLIGSIIAVTILIGVSFTSVVGYRSVDPNVNASPLFNIRTSRAIDEECRELSCEYVGKGLPNSIIGIKEDGRIELILESITIIKDMNDITYGKFVDLLIDIIHRYNGNYKIYNNDYFIKNKLDKLRMTPIEQLENIVLEINYSKGKNVENTVCTWCTMWKDCTVVPTPQCFFWLITLYVGFLIDILSKAFFLLLLIWLLSS